MLSLNLCPEMVTTIFATTNKAKSQTHCVAAQSDAVRVVPPPRWFNSLDGISVSCAIRHNGLESPSSLDFFQNDIKGQFNCRDLS